MGRKATGTVEWMGDHWRARVTLPDGSRPWVELEASIPRDREDLAKAEALAYSDLMRREAFAKDAPAPKAPAPAGETVTAWFERWHVQRRAQGRTSARIYESYVNTHVLPALGDEPMAGVTREQLEDLVAALDDKVVADKLSGKTARNVWGVVSKAFADAAGAKRREFRVRSDNPALGVAPPEPGVEKALTYLYPSEFLKLVTCPEVPVRWAQLYAVAIYLYTRPGELEVLGCESIDLEHGTAHLHVARDDLTGGVKEIKTGVARTVRLEPALQALVAHLHAEAGGRGPLLPWHPAEKKLAPALREHLEAAGVKRAALFTTDATRKQLRFYDLRATGITWCAVRGDEPLRLMQRAGHEDFKTTQRYIREAENLSAGFGSPFPPLPARLLETSRNRPAGMGEMKKPRKSGANSWVAGVGFEPAQARETSTVSTEGQHISEGPMRTDDTPRHPADDSRTIAGGPRAALLEALSAAVRDATAAGDLACARIAHDALGQLLGAAAAAPGAGAVIDLAGRRGRS